MTKDILEFNSNIQFVEGRGDLCKYVDAKGNYFLLPLAQLFLNCEYIELNEPNFKAMQFNGELDKELEYEKITAKTFKDKFEVTKNAKDKGTIVEADEEVSRVWIVRNGFKLAKTFNNMEEAHKLVNEFNDKLIAKMPKEV
jgi:hypothetical protein